MARTVNPTLNRVTVLSLKQKVSPTWLTNSAVTETVNHWLRIAGGLVYVSQSRREMCIEGLDMFDTQAAASANDLNSLLHPPFSEFVQLCTRDDVLEMPMWHGEEAAVGVGHQRSVEVFAQNF